MPHIGAKLGHILNGPILMHLALSAESSHSSPQSIRICFWCLDAHKEYYERIFRQHLGENRLIVIGVLVCNLAATHIGLSGFNQGA